MNGCPIGLIGFVVAVIGAVIVWSIRTCEFIGFETERARKQRSCSHPESGILTWHFINEDREHWTDRKCQACEKFWYEKKADASMKTFARWKD